MRREADVEKGRGDTGAPTATGHVRVLHLAHPPSDLRLSEAARQEAVTLTLPPTDGGGLAGVTVNSVVAAARRQLRLGDAALQLSLHGVVLPPQQDVAEMLSSVPRATRQRLVFLLSPSHAVGAGAKGEEAIKTPRQVMFAEPPLSASPTQAALAPTRNGEATHSPSLHAAVDAASGRESPAPQCVFFESWLHPHRCGRCQRVRAQHCLFAPTRQERLQSGMTLAKKTTRPQRRQSPETGVALQKLVLPYYYADPRQWRPQRGERYHGHSETCHDFCASWGNPQLCRNCQRPKEMHQVDDKRAVGRPSATPARRQRSLESSFVHAAGNTSPPAYARKACPHLVPSSNSEYCTACYSRRVKQISQVERCSPLIHVTPRRQRASPARAKTHSLEDWLALPSAEEGTATVRRGEARSRVNTKRGRKQLDGAGRGRGLTLVEARPYLSFSSSSSASSFAGPGAPPVATVPKRRNNRGAAVADIPWGLVLQYTTLDELRVCRSVSSAMRTAAVPLIHENCTYILNVFDVPRRKRELLVQHADRYASLILDALRQRTPCYAPMDAATHPLRFRRFCLLRFLAAMQALSCGSEDGVVEAAIQLGRNRASPAPSGYLLSFSPTGHVLAGGRSGKGGTVGDAFAAQEFAHDAAAKTALVPFIKRLAWCDPASLSRAAVHGIVDAFEAISVAAAASLVHRCDDGQLTEVGRDTQQTRFFSLEEFFDKHALLPLVDFLQTVEVVAQMKWKTQIFVGAHSHDHHLHRRLCHFAG
ncbi:uncharacterized protein Tco025E_06689 [Trypanosoma conorhini]|uniref:Uncharacterized protein n=1 Tax=Trypanosoma conorhini TaxID=83891 RepID=A0A3R7RR83_9TRYP|nr:uncharacterized protein Tco025E_06689 [Trypanosoma conorhini]RNF11154.1 hypothetical protein Tco025E_06689 [Trypanosoma conorhini]